MLVILYLSISSKSNIVDLSCYCLPCSFSSFYLIRSVYPWVQDLDLKERQRSKRLLADWYNVELFTDPPGRHDLVYEATPAASHDLENPRWIFIASPLCFS